MLPNFSLLRLDQHKDVPMGGKVPADYTPSPKERAYAFFLANRDSADAQDPITLDSLADGYDQSDHWDSVMWYSARFDESNRFARRVAKVPDSWSTAGPDALVQLTPSGGSIVEYTHKGVLLASFAHQRREHPNGDTVNGEYRRYPEAYKNPAAGTGRDFFIPTLAADGSNAAAVQEMVQVLDDFLTECAQYVANPLAPAAENIPLYKRSRDVVGGDTYGDPFPRGWRTIGQPGDDSDDSDESIDPVDEGGGNDSGIETDDSDDSEESEEQQQQQQQQNVPADPTMTQEHPVIERLNQEGWRGERAFSPEIVREELQNLHEAIVAAHNRVFGATIVPRSGLPRVLNSGIQGGPYEDLNQTLKSRLRGMLFRMHDSWEYWALVFTYPNPEDRNLTLACLPMIIDLYRFHRQAETFWFLFYASFSPPTARTMYRSGHRPPVETMQGVRLEASHTLYGALGDWGADIEGVQYGFWYNAVLQDNVKLAMIAVDNPMYPGGWDPRLPDDYPWMAGTAVQDPFAGPGDDFPWYNGQEGSELLNELHLARSTPASWRPEARQESLALYLNHRLPRPGSEDELREYYEDAHIIERVIILVSQGTVSLRTRKWLFGWLNERAGFSLKARERMTITNNDDMNLVKITNFFTRVNNDHSMMDAATRTMISKLSMWCQTTSDKRDAVRALEQFVNSVDMLPGVIEDATREFNMHFRTITEGLDTEDGDFEYFDCFTADPGFDEFMDTVWKAWLDVRNAGFHHRYKLLHFFEMVARTTEEAMRRSSSGQDELLWFSDFRNWASLDGKARILRRWNAERNDAGEEAEDLVTARWLIRHLERFREVDSDDDTDDQDIMAPARRQGRSRNRPWLEDDHYGRVDP